MVTHSKRGSCRIIGGKWRGRKISFDDAQGLRPTTDRIRETVFNWLQFYVPRSRCLDAFAGSGVLGFEALSRGASEVVFVEQAAKTVDRLKQNAATLDTQSAQIHHGDTLQWLKSAGHNESLKKYFDIVFLDPPFHSTLLAESCVLLAESGCLADDARIYVEHASDVSVAVPHSWHCLKEKKSGQVVYKLFENRVAGPHS